MWCVKFYVAYVGKKRCLVIYKLTRSAVRLTKNGTSLSIEHATEIASLIGDRWSADKYKQAFSKPLGVQFVYLCTFCICFFQIWTIKWWFSWVKLRVPLNIFLEKKPCWILTKKRHVHYTVLHTSVTDNRLNWTVCLGHKISCMWQCESQSVTRHLLHTTGNC